MADVVGLVGGRLGLLLLLLEAGQPVVGADQPPIAVVSTVGTQDILAEGIDLLNFFNYLGVVVLPLPL